jgi:hypothetical protein
MWLQVGPDAEETAMGISEFIFGAGSEQPQPEKLA